MNRVRVIVICLLLLAFPAFPQSVHSFKTVPSVPVKTTIVRDPQAIQVVEQSLAAMGGQAALEQLRSADTTGSFSADPGSSPSGTFDWKTKLEGNHFELRRDNIVDGQTRIFATGHGRPKDSQNGKTSALHAHIAMANPPLYLPGLVLVQQLDNPNYSLKLVSNSAAVDGKPATAIQTSLETNGATEVFTRQTWYFDQTTWLPIKVEFRVPTNRNVLTFKESSFIFGQFKPTSGIVLPMTLEGVSSGRTSYRFEIGSVVLNPSIDESEFDLPVVSR